VGVKSVEKALNYFPIFFGLICLRAAGNANTVNHLKVPFGQYISVLSIEKEQATEDILTFADRSCDRSKTVKYPSVNLRHSYIKKKF